MERVLGFQHSMLLLAEPAGDRLVVAATRGYGQPAAEVRVRIGDGVIGVVAKRRTPMTPSPIRTRASRPGSA